MSKFIQENYDLGYSLSLDLIEELGFKTEDNPTHEHFAGVLTCLFNAMYTFAPEKAVTDLTTMAQNFALEDIKKEAEDE
tara:strand:+ start:223 stop:459 length:237 start_codon:yes stop_codon:yes gene_type:complete